MPPRSQFGYKWHKFGTLRDDQFRIKKVGVDEYEYVTNPTNSGTRINRANFKQRV